MFLKLLEKHLQKNRSLIDFFFYTPDSDSTIIPIAVIAIPIYVITFIDLYTRVPKTRVCV